MPPFKFQINQYKRSILNELPIFESFRTPSSCMSELKNTLPYRLLKSNCMALNLQFQCTVVFLNVYLALSSDEVCQADQILRNYPMRLVFHITPLKSCIQKPVQDSFQDFLNPHMC